METWFKRVFLILCLGTALVGDLEQVQAQDLSVIRPDVRPQPVNEALIDSENVEVGVYGGILHIEDFESSPVWGVRLAYHLSELVFIEGSVGFADAGETSFEKLAGDVQVLADSERDYRFYSLGLGLNLFPGEVFVGENHAFNTNAYLVAGAGAREFAGDTRFSLTLGFGYQFVFTDSLALHLGFREHAYRIDVLGEDKTALDPETSVGLSVFF